MSAYVVLGHGSEKKVAERPIVPAGSALVLTEECGMTGVFPHFIYPILADPANAVLFRDPVTHKATIERLIRRPIRIYSSGSEYPALSYTLLSHTSEYTQVEPSGVFELPTPDFVAHPSKRGEARYTVAAEDVARVFEGAVVPRTIVQKASLKQLETSPALRTTQAALFKAYPGVYYSLLCRVIEEEDHIKELITQHFPEYNLNDIFTVEGDDPFLTTAYWITDVTPKTNIQRAAITEMKQIVKDVMERRNASGSSLGDQRLMTLLAMRSPPATLVDQQIAELPQVNIRDRRNGYTPLMMATRMGHRTAISAILARGANVNARDNEGSTALLFVSDPAIAAILLDHGADPTLVSDDGVTTLHVVASIKGMEPIVHRILSLGGNPNAQDHEGDTPLHVAGTRRIAEMLLAAGADTNLQNEEGFTPLMAAIEEGDTDVAEVLIPLTNLGLRSEKGTTALGYAIKAKQDKIAVALIAAGNPVQDWNKIAEVAKQYGLHGLEAVAHSRTERRNNRRNTIKKTSSHGSGNFHKRRS